MAGTLRVSGARAVRWALMKSKPFPSSVRPGHRTTIGYSQQVLRPTSRWRHLTSTTSAPAEPPDSAAEAAERGLRILREHSNPLEQGGV